MIAFLPERAIFLVVGDWQVRWYGVLYVVAFWLAWWMLPRLQKYRQLKLADDDWARILVWGVVGVLIGGRLGYAIFYELGFYLSNPAQLLAIWSGGMSSHGGFIGATIGVWYAVLRLCKKSLASSGQKNSECFVTWLQILDVVVVPVAIGLALGRFGNWINQELYIGNFALLAMGKNLLIAAATFVGLKVLVPILRRTGRVVALFLILYSILRFGTEYVRVLEWPIAFGLRRGQLLTLPVLLVGLWLWKYGNKVKPIPPLSDSINS